MPEEVEIDTDDLRESIHEELEREGSGFIRTIALTTAILAACAAIASLKAGGTANEALVLKTQAGEMQAEASDQWAFYQAKGIKQAVAAAAEASWRAAGKTPPQDIIDKQTRYARDQDSIQKVAKEKEQARDEASKESEHQLHAHHAYANSVALFQVSIALGALAALTRLKSVWFGSMALGAVGLVLFIIQLVQPG